MVFFFTLFIYFIESSQCVEHIFLIYIDNAASICAAHKDMSAREWVANNIFYVKQ